MEIPDEEYVYVVVYECCVCKKIRFPDWEPAEPVDRIDTKTGVVERKLICPGCLEEMEKQGKILPPEGEEDDDTGNTMETN